MSTEVPRDQAPLWMVEAWCTGEEKITAERRALDERRRDMLDELIEFADGDMEVLFGEARAKQIAAAAAEVPSS